MNDYELEHRHFPRLFHRLAQDGEVWVEIDLAPHFAHFLLRNQREVWQHTEQSTSVREDWKTRFYLRKKPVGERAPSLDPTART